MSYPAFIADVRLACGFLSPDAWESGQVTDPDDRLRAAELADVWLTPAVVADYSPLDFGPTVGRHAEGVRNAVEAFRLAVAADPRPVDTALAALLGLLSAVRRDLVTPELLTVRRAIWRGWRPARDWIPMFDCELIHDWTGDPSIQVHLILNDDVDVEAAATQRRLAGVREAIEDGLTEAGVTRWPYIGVWDRSGAKELLARASA